MTALKKKILTKKSVLIISTSFFVLFVFIMFVWLLVPLGVIVIIFADKIYNFTGDIDFAEKYLGAGGTHSFIKLTGLGITILSFVWAVGGIQGVLNATLGKLF